MNPYHDQTITAASDTDVGAEAPVITGFDRLTMWLDRPELPIAQRHLEKHCTKIEVHVKQMKFQARWKLQIEIFQPTIKCLQILAQALGTDIATLLTYVEIACDSPAKSKNQAPQWCDAFLASAHMRYQRQMVVLYQGTWYYGRRTYGTNKRSNVLAVYADLPSKLNNARPAEDLPPCLHIEWRATGADTLQMLGIAGLDDLIQFDHPRFWDQHIRMYQLPKPTALGRLLAETFGADSNVSGSALRKRAARWKEQYSIENKFIMHNALLANPNLVHRFKTVPFSEWLELTVLQPQDE